MKWTTDRAVLVLAGCVFCCLTAAPIGAEVVEIHFTGLDVQYDSTTSEIMDLGMSDMPDLDALTRMTFVVDGEVIADLSDDAADLYADVLLEMVPPVPTGSSVVAASGLHYIDLWTVLGFDIHVLQLDVDDVDISVDTDAMTFGVTGFSSGVFSQDLPFGLQFDETEPILVEFSGTLLDFQDDGQWVTSLDAATDGALVSMAIPEPSTAVLLATLGLACLLLRAFRRQTVY